MKINTRLIAESFNSSWAEQIMAANRKFKVMDRSDRMGFQGVDSFEDGSGPLIATMAAAPESFGKNDGAIITIGICEGDLGIAITILTQQKQHTLNDKEFVKICSSIEDLVKTVRFIQDPITGAEVQGFDRTL